MASPYRYTTPVAKHAASGRVAAVYAQIAAEFILADGPLMSLSPAPETLAATSIGGRTAVMRPDPARPLGFSLSDRPLPPLADGCIEAAFAAEAPAAVANLHAARPAIHDAASFQRMRTEDGFMDVAVFDAFDAVASIAHTSCTEYVSAQSETQAGI